MMALVMTPFSCGAFRAHCRGMVMRGPRTGRKTSLSLPDLRLRGNQDEFVRLMRDRAYSIVVATGSAGTGKTMLACTEAVRSLENKHVKRIVITRPTVVSDEEQGLGFLPGDLETKMSPWVRPIMDHLTECLSAQQVRSWVADGTIEIAPLCFMRGRTFKEAFIIGDECQNVRPPIMKMLLTRLGANSKMVVVGDLEQTDFSAGTMNGLSDFIHRVRASPRKGIGVIRLTHDCIARHPVIPDVLDLYRGVETHDKLAK